MTDLVHRRTRSHLLLALPDVEIKYIHHAFKGEGFAPNPDADTDGLGERKSLGTQYLASVDWINHSHVHRAIGAFEQLLLYIPANGMHRYNFIESMKRDGYNFDPFENTFRSRAHQFEQLGQADIAGLERHLERIRTSIDRDPAVAIGSAKELCESVAKTVLRHRESSVDAAIKFPQLIRLVNESLGLSAGTHKGPDGSDSVVKALGALTTVALSLAEIRNAFGTGHGAAEVAAGNLSPRHARLAVNAAAAWCEFVIETLNDPAAPWRKTPTT